MFLSNLIKEYSLYVGTPDYWRGVLVEITGIVIEVCLLSITIPIVLHLVRRMQTRPIRIAVDFYLFQVFHKITRMFLEMANASDIKPILAEETRRNNKFVPTSHPLYGDLDDILFVLEMIFAKDSFRAEVNKRSAEEFEKYHDTVVRCIDEIDRLAAMSSQIPGLQNEIFSMRMLAYPLRDVLDDVIKALRASDPDSHRKKFAAADVHVLAERVTEGIGTIFQNRRKQIDSVISFRVLGMLLALPIVFFRRWIVLYYCRFTGKPFRDSACPSPWPKLISRWQRKMGFTQQQAMEALGFTVRDFSEIEMGYREPTTEELKKLKPLIQDAVGINRHNGDTEHG